VHPIATQVRLLTSKMTHATSAHRSARITDRR
jgi:hypothetical protein